jgi:TRAP-type C4-dicarboxylate transport system permease small subunit
MKKVLCWLDKHLEEVVCVIMLAAVTVLIGAGVFCRYVLKNSLPWSDELARYCFIYSVFVGMGLAVRENGNMKIDILELSIPKIKPFLCVVQDVIYFAFLLYVIPPGIDILQKFATNPQTSPAMKIPMQFVYVSFLIGVILAIFRLVEKYYIKGKAYLIRKKQEGGDGK